MAQIEWMSVSKIDQRCEESNRHWAISEIKLEQRINKQWGKNSLNGTINATHTDKYEEKKGVFCVL